MEQLNVYTKDFTSLSLQELYSIMWLRQEVFVVEQDCPYLDADGKDQDSHHLCIYKGNDLVAYTRLLPKGISYEKYSSIGRVVTAPSVRGTGIGKELMKVSIEEMKRLFPKDNIKISAQCYLLKFYESFGFVKVGKEYLEDNIPHHGMVLEIES